MESADGDMDFFNIFDEIVPCSEVVESAVGLQVRTSTCHRDRKKGTAHRAWDMGWVEGEEGGRGASRETREGGVGLRNAGQVVKPKPRIRVAVGGELGHDVVEEVRPLRRRHERLEEPAKRTVRSREQARQAKPAHPQHASAVFAKPTLRLPQLDLWFFWGFLLMRLYRALRGCSCGSRGFRRGPDDGHNHWQGATSSTSRVTSLQGQSGARTAWAISVRSPRAETARC